MCAQKCRPICINVHTHTHIYNHKTQLLEGNIQIKVQTHKFLLQKLFASISPKHIFNKENMICDVFINIFNFVPGL